MKEENDDIIYQYTQSISILLLSHVLLQPHGEAEACLSQVWSQGQPLISYSCAPVAYLSRFQPIPIILHLAGPLMCDVRVEKGPRYLNVEVK